MRLWSEFQKVEQLDTVAKDYVNHVYFQALPVYADPSTKYPRPLMMRSHKFKLLCLQCHLRRLGRSKSLEDDKVTSMRHRKISPKPYKPCQRRSRVRMEHPTIWQVCPFTNLVSMTTTRLAGMALTQLHRPMDNLRHLIQQMGPAAAHQSHHLSL